MDRKFFWACLVVSATYLLTTFNDVAQAACQNQITIKYRDTPYCIDSSTCVDTPESSFVRRACFNSQQSYMAIKLNHTWYHYCRFDSGTWNALLAADSKGRFYNARIKGNFDCRNGGVAD